MKERGLEVLMGFMLLLFVYLISSRAGMMVSGQNVTAAEERPVVVIDSGHGGYDPGKVGVNGSLEKDINLQIALRLKSFLEAADVRVVMTREDDRGLYEEGDSNKKAADMKNRCARINEAEPALVVSIHQNSYHEEYVRGGQVFYYKDSEKGKRLAQILQRRFDYVLGEENTRNEKPNGNYYLLLHVRRPIVIVECGFLSNWQEAAALATEDYQSRLAWTIHMGILEYLNTDADEIT
ncbi:MAG: N-acetylmuramoyl-L-alanine amidase [Clostridiales bacterium]|nr:N-acetylmuramoyl-L-alanine amidase [Clostridiales bacterium]